MREEVVVHILCTLFLCDGEEILDSGLFWQRFTLFLGV
jgi:hypothetical protein